MENLPFPKKTYNKKADIYKLLSNPKRLEILNILERQSEEVFEDLVKILNIRKANVSQHLAVLRHAGFVKVRHEGVHAYYSVAEPGIVETWRALQNMQSLNKLKKRKMIP